MYRHPHKKEKKFLVDKILTPLAIVSPFFAIPQFYDVWFLHQVDGVSVVSWFLFGITTMFWFWHGVAHKDNLLKINCFLSVLFNFSIAIGALLYS